MSDHAQGWAMSNTRTAYLIGGPGFESEDVTIARPMQLHAYIPIIYVPLRECTRMEPEQAGVSPTIMVAMYELESESVVYRLRGLVRR